MHLLDIGDEHTDNGPDSLESPIVCTMPSVLAQILLQEVLCEYRFRIDVVFIKVLYECIDIVHAVVPQSSNQLSIYNNAFIIPHSFSEHKKSSASAEPLLNRQLPILPVRLQTSTFGL